LLGAGWQSGLSVARWSALVVDAEEANRGGDGFDSLNIAFWDAYAGCYREYHREFRSGYRDMMTSTSEDFLHWMKPEWLDYGGAPQEHLYQGQILPYFRAPHILLAFPDRFVPSRKIQLTHPAEGISDGVFMSSRDGVHFDRSFMEGWIRPGLDPRNWMHAGTSPSWGLLQTGPEELSVYWIQNYYTRMGDKTYGEGACYVQRGSLRSMASFPSMPTTAAGSSLPSRLFSRGESWSSTSRPRRWAVCGWRYRIRRAIPSRASRWPTVPKLTVTPSSKR